MSDQLTKTFSALADPTRRRMLQRLMRGDATMSALARPFAMSIPAAAKHVRILERCGLLARTRRAQSRPCHLRTQPLQDAIAWMESYRKFWEESFDELEAQVELMRQERKQNARKKTDR